MKGLLCRSLGRRAFLTMSGVAFVGTALAGCAPRAATPAPKEEAPTKAPAKVEATKLKYTSWGNETRLKADEKNIVAFNDQNPDIEVEFIGIAADYNTQVLTMIAAGDSPDVLRINAWNSQGYFAKGSCLALDDYFAQEGIKPEEIYVAPFVQCVYKGKWYGIPRGGTGMQIVYYNKPMFDEAGVAYPEDPEWTWDDLLDTAKALTKKGADGKTEQWGFDFWCWNDGGWQTAVWGNGGAILNEEHTKCLLDQPEAVEGIQWWADLRCKEGVAPTPGQIPEGMGNPFFAGLTAMCQCGTWAVNTLRPTEWEWGIVIWPVGPKEHVSFSKPNTCSIGSATKEPDASWRLEKYLGGEEVAKRDAESGLWPPNVKSLMNSDWYRTSDQKPYDLSPTVVGLQAKVRGLPLTVNAAEVNSAIWQEMQLVLTCEEPAETAIARAKENVDALLAEIEQ